MPDHSPRTTATRRRRLTADSIVDAAVDLTRDRGLTGWTVRDLTDVLDASMSSVYHHVGGRDAIAGRVVERVIGDIDWPPDDVDWKQWYSKLLMTMVDRLGEYRGVARWILMHGPIFDDTVPKLDVAIAVLQKAGFGDDAVLVYSIIFNTMVGSVALVDDRDEVIRGDTSAGRDHATMSALLRTFTEAGPGARAMAEWIGSLAQGTDTRDPTSRHYTQTLLTTLLDGLEQRLHP